MKHHDNNREDVERLLRYFSILFLPSIPDLNILRSRCFSERVVTRLDSEDDHLRLENRSSSESGYQTRGEDREDREAERAEWDEEVFIESAGAKSSHQYRSHHRVPS